jgi:hypothetical protein
LSPSSGTWKEYMTISIFRWKRRVFDFLRHQVKANVISICISKENLSDSVSAFRYEKKASDYLPVEGKNVWFCLRHQVQGHQTVSVTFARKGYLTVSICMRKERESGYFSIIG